MRKPPDKDGGAQAVAERSQQETNTTVNAFLGGRQKAWMTVGPSVRPTPRADKENNRSIQR